MAMVITTEDRPELLVLARHPDRDHDRTLHRRPELSPAMASFTIATWVRLSTDQLAMDNETWVAIAGTENFLAGVETARWLHLAAIVDVDANLVTLYKDGSIGDQETRPSDVSMGDSTLYLGRWNMYGRLFSGDLDDVAIWNRALTANEIAALVAEAPPPAAGMH